MTRRFEIQSYKSLLRHKMQKLTALDCRRIIQAMDPEQDPRQLNKMSVSALKNVLNDIMTEENALELSRDMPEIFVMSYHEMQDYAAFDLTYGQVEHLARLGRIGIGKTRKSTLQPGTTVDLYDPFDIAALADEDYGIPDVPNKLTQSVLIASRCWTKSLIAKHLPPPEKIPNPVYKSAKPMLRWSIRDIEAAEAKPEVAEAIAKIKARREAK